MENPINIYIINVCMLKQFVRGIIFGGEPMASVNATGKCELIIFSHSKLITRQ